MVRVSADFTIFKISIGTYTTVRQKPQIFLTPPKRRPQILALDMNQSETSREAVLSYYDRFGTPIRNIEEATSACPGNTYLGFLH